MSRPGPRSCQCGDCTACRLRDRHRVYTRLYRGHGLSREPLARYLGHLQWLRDCSAMARRLAIIPSSLNPRRTYALPAVFTRTRWTTGV